MYVRLFHLLWLVLLTGPIHLLAQTQVLQLNYADSGQPPKDLLGVNIGPGSSVKGYQEVGIRSIRTHDYYGPCDYWYYTTQALDTVQRRFRAGFDPTLPASYRWKSTDDKIDSIVRFGFSPFFRLGVSYPSNPSVPTYPPLDASGSGFQTFAEICRRTAMHYTKGWDNGYTHPITYWEIWNEPDFKDKFWSGSAGTPINYYAMYKSSSAALKAVDPSFKVGGPGVAYASLIFSNPAYIRDFMAYCQANTLPLDFYSWHLYDIKNPYGIQAYADSIRIQLDRFGFKKTESIITEINPDLKGSAYLRNTKGAAWIIGAFITCQRAAVDHFYWYRGVQLGPLVDDDLGTQPNPFWTGWAYKMYAAFLAENNRTLPVAGELVVRSHFDQDTTSLLAMGGKSPSGDTVALLLSNLNSTVTSLEIQLNNIPWSGDARIEWIALKAPDQRYTTRTAFTAVKEGQIRFILPDMGSPSACLLRFIRSQATPSEELAFMEQPVVAPNPTSDWLHLTFPAASTQRTVTLLDIQGRPLQQWIAPDKQLQIDVRPYPTGTYFLRINQQTIPFVKQ